MTNFQKLKLKIEIIESVRQNKGLDQRFFNSVVNITAIEEYCKINQGSLSRALKRNQKSVAFDENLSKLFE